MNDHTQSLSSSEFEHVTFVAEVAAGQTVLMEFPEPIKRRAVLVRSGPAGTHPQPVPADDLLILSVPAPVQEDADLLAHVRAWVDAATPDNDRKSQMIALQGAQIFWAPGCAALLTHADRHATVRKALIEFSYYEGELRAIERDLGGLWPELEADAPLAFEFNEKSVRKRQLLSRRFQQVLAIRSRLAWITPHVLCPHLHPPTLASQVGERLRERTRLTHRLEFISGQLEIFERVYELCGQRASDFMHARISHTLEWVIIILLLAQTILVSVDLMSTLGK